jgi:uncharacterized membrane protein YagU involved in acid resistance
MHTTNPASSPSGDTLANLLIGAVAGVAAVWVMDRVDNFNFRHEDAAARQRTRTVRPDGQPPAQVMVEQAARHAGRPLSRERVDRIGQGAHYLIGATPAMLYAALAPRYPQITRGRGVLFGLGLFVVQDELINPLMGWSAKPTAYPWQAHARGLVAHVVFGLAADAVVRALQGRRRTRHGAIDARAASAAQVADDAAVIRTDNDAVVAPLHAAAAQPTTDMHGAAGAGMR